MRTITSSDLVILAAVVLLAIAHVAFMALYPAA